MNCWVIRWHYEIGSDVYTNEKCFDDIIDFKYCTDFDGPYVLIASSIDEYTNKAYPASFMIGQFDNDYIYYNGIFVRMSGNKVDFLLKYIDDQGISRSGILTRSRKQKNRIAHIDFDGEIIKHKDLVENYNRAAMLIEHEKTKSAIDSLE